MTDTNNNNTGQSAALAPETATVRPPAKWAATVDERVAQLLGAESPQKLKYAAIKLIEND